MTLAARRIGVSRRALPAYLMRKLIQAAHEGRNEVALGDDVFLVRRVQPVISEVPPVRGTFMGVLMDAEAKVTAAEPNGTPTTPPKPSTVRNTPVPQERKADWPFFTPSSRS